MDFSKDIQVCNQNNTTWHNSKHRLKENLRNNSDSLKILNTLTYPLKSTFINQPGIT